MATNAPVFETEPVACAADAGAFLNTVLEVETPDSIDVHRLLDSLRYIERQMGRSSRYPRNASRPIDLDILYAGDQRMESPRLTLPPPRLHLRRCVLAPLAAIRPALMLPDQRQTVAEILRDLDDAASVRLMHPVW